MTDISSKSYAISDHDFPKRSDYLRCAYCGKEVRNYVKPRSLPYTVITLDEYLYEEYIQSSFCKIECCWNYFFSD